MTASEVENGLRVWLEEALAAGQGAIEEGDATLPAELADLARVTTFEEDGLLTRDKGIVLRFGNGSVFQVSIVRSR